MRRKLSGLYMKKKDESKELSSLDSLLFSCRQQLQQRNKKQKEKEKDDGDTEFKKFKYTPRTISKKYLFEYH